MKSFISNRLKSLFLIFIIPFYSYSQNSIDTSDTVIDNYSFLMINASYTSNNLEYLTGTTAKIPTLFTNISYINKTGLYLGGSYANYFNANSKTLEYDIEAGFQKYFDSGFDFDLYYNKHEFSGDTLLEGLNYKHSFNATTGIDISKFYLSVEYSYLLMSLANNSFLNLNLSRNMQFEKVLFKNDVLLISPTISLSFGTDFWIYDDMTRLERYNISVDLESSGFTYNSFGYEGFDIFIPISYGIKNTYFSFSWLYRIPSEKYKYLGWENQSGIMISLTQFFNFMK